MSFLELGLDQSLIKALTDHGYTQPTPIQEATIVPVLEGKDIMASAQTGTGKTAAFTLPMLQRLNSSSAKSRAPRALVLAPTRELAAQVLASVNTYGRHISLKAVAVFGGVKIGPQISALRQGVDIVVATPGRLLDLCQQRAIDLGSIEILVLDEADRMLDMGFINDIRKVIAKVPTVRQTLMFSATFSREIRELASAMMKDPVQISVDPLNEAAGTVDQCVIAVDKKRKPEAMAKIYEIYNGAQSLVFTRTKHGANKLVKVLHQSGVKAEAIHGNKSQAHRTRVLSDFKSGKVTVLVATDIASRGLDIKELPLVINYELPNTPEDYVHRIGRTGRAGKNGFALSLVSADEIKQLHAIERLSNKQITRDKLEGFEPEAPLPLRAPRGNQSAASNQNGKPNQRRRAKRPSNDRSRGRKVA